MNKPQYRAYCHFNNQYIYSSDYPQLCDFFCMAQTLEDSNGKVTIEEQLLGFLDQEGMQIFEGDLLGKYDIYVVRKGKFSIGNVFSYGFFLENLETNQYIALNSICSQQIIGNINKQSELTK